MTIARALLSVSDKTGLVPFAQFLAAQGVEILSTGGTARALRDAGLTVKDVSGHTGFPEMMDGRVKTLHPKIHGGLLALRDHPEHLRAMKDHGITPIDLVVINLYPFEQTVAKGASFDDCIENIDIGGPAMVRSSAKNHAYVTIITDPADYEVVMAEMKTGSGATTPETRRKLAAKAFARTAAYDSAISQWFAAQHDELFPKQLQISASLKQPLSYGENPHQQAAFYALPNPRFGLVTARQLQGKELSYNNINDTDAAWELVSEFDAPAVAIIKHANPCGVATGKDLREAYLRAYACDTTSAFGGIIAVNRELDVAAAEEMSKLFVEVIIAPKISKEAAELLAKKTKLRVLETGGMPDPKAKDVVVKSVTGGLLVQTRDDTLFDEAALKTATKLAPTNEQLADLTMALTVAKHVKSNAIVLVKNGQTVGIGAGQMSRIDSTKIAVRKACEAGLSTQGAALASEAFFPFADNVLLAAESGISAIIQPGGSIRDSEVIEAADKAGIAMVFTGVRHFRH
ncbi:MAG: bifunctional phosphoribosylaminoimidazolecarboxamide formyltransferase/IMP cyclohydrolase [Alphaproteobacteria bacterium]|nr:bifunctional phosphoribosylaminoimidazolecarboxamide formyltransferase/IMP cyclohydrolase [Alphaproteobacteria bacterium]